MIRQYFDQRCVFVTGGTGFIGQALIAKILRDLPGVRRVYALVRDRVRADGGVISAKDRLEHEFFQGSVFGAFRRQDPDGFRAARQKVVAVAGDVTEPGLGMDAAVREELCRELDTIIAVAATVVFDEPLDDALRLNTRGPLSLLDLARACAKTVHFVHVSTAYVNGQWTGTIPEEPLPIDKSIRELLERGADGPGNFDPESLIAECEEYCLRLRKEAAGEKQTRQFRREILAQRRRRKLTRSRLAELVEDRRQRWVERRLVDEGMRRAKEHGWHDVYSFTKALGEMMLVKKRGDQPLAIVRPSITESSLEDPEPGWISGLKVMDPLAAAYGRGLLPDFPLEPELVLDLIPVDFVVNALLAAAPRCAADEVHVYHVASSSENPVTVRALFDNVRAHFVDRPMLDRDGKAPKLPQWKYPGLRRFRLTFRLKYLIPLAIQEWVLGRLPSSLAPASKRRLVATLKMRLRRVFYYTDIYYPYTHLRCQFDTRRTRDLYEQLPGDEQRIFNLDVSRIDWPRYLRDVHVPGLRRHVLRDDGAEEVLLRGAPEEMGEQEERWQAEEEINNLPDLLHWAAARYGGRTAFQMKRSGEWVSCTYMEVLTRARAQASHWQGLGLASGDRLILCGASCPEWVIACLATSTLGVCVVPLDPQTPPAELWRLAALAKAKGVVASGAVWSSLKATMGSAPADLLCLHLERHGLSLDDPREALPAADPAWVPARVTPEMGASIIFTSGTVVEPRGVVLTHGSFIADLLALSEVHRAHEGDHVLSLLPLHHAFEFTGSLLASLLGGATTTYLETLNSREILGAMEQTGTTAMLASPRLLKVLMDRIHRLDRTPAQSTAVGSKPPAALSRHAALLGRLRLIVSGGAPLGTELFEAYRAMGVTIHEGYGLTEASPVITVNPPDGARRGSTGQALPGVELAIEDPDDQGRGEILVRGPILMRGYLDQPELTDQVLREGWLHTGDVGYLDDDGYLFLTGRCRDLIVTGAGKNVYPGEVEELYRDLPHVSELAAVGVANPRTVGEEIHGIAVVQQVSREGAVSSGEIEGEIKSRAYEISRDLPTYQRIQHLHVWWRSLPRLDDGRVNRQTLISELEGERAEVGAVTDADEGLPPWERAMYRRLSAITGLDISEVMADADAPLDTFMDSLMGVEFAASLDPLSRAPAAIDRTRSLRALLDEVGPPESSSPAQTGPQPAHWSEMLNPGGEAAVAHAVATGGGTVRRLFWGLTAAAVRRYFSLTVEGVEHLPQDRPYVLAGNHTSHLDGPAVLLSLRHQVSDLIVVDDSKLVSRLGTKSPLPVEVVPYGLSLAQRKLAVLASEVTLRPRKDANQPYVTDNGNYILDCRFADGIDDPGETEQRIGGIPGVVESGLFVGLTDVVVVAREAAPCQILERPGS
ncbi:ribose-5-phosphate isomerase A [Candidatus Latescibacterota bacterium]